MQWHCYLWLENLQLETASVAGKEFGIKRNVEESIKFHVGSVITGLKKGSGNLSEVESNIHMKTGIL